MSDSIFDDKPVPSPSEGLSPRAAVLVISAFLLGAYVGNFVPQPFSSLMMAGGLVGLVAYLTSEIVKKRQYHKQERERTNRTESRLEKHVTSQSSMSMPAVDVNMFQNRTPTP